MSFSSTTLNSVVFSFLLRDMHHEAREAGSRLMLHFGMRRGVIVAGAQGAPKGEGEGGGEAMAPTAVA